MARKILLADDSVTAQNMGRKILADAGYDVVTVNNGSAALKRITEIKPDLIVLDVYMPGYSGLEVCQRLKDANETAHIPVLLTVGKLEPFKAEEARRVRADAHIVKPFEASELLTAITRLEDRMVPQPSETGRFSSSVSGVERFGNDGSARKTDSNADADTGWKSRLRFPSKKKKEEPEPESEDLAAGATFRDFRKGKGKAGASFTVKAPPPPGQEPGLVPDIPRDITPEELDALSELVSKLDGPIPEAESVAPLADAIGAAESQKAEVAVSTPVVAGLEVPATEAEKTEAEKTEAEALAVATEPAYKAEPNHPEKYTEAVTPVHVAESAAAGLATSAVEGNSEVQLPVEPASPAAEPTITAGVDLAAVETHRREIERPGEDQQPKTQRPETSVAAAAVTVNAAVFAQAPAPVERDDEPMFASAASAVVQPANEKIAEPVEAAPANGADSKLEESKANDLKPEALQPVELRTESRAKQLASETAEREEAPPSDEELAEALRLLTPATGHADVSIFPSHGTLVAAGQLLAEEAARNAAAGPRWVAEPVALSPEEAAISLEAEMFRTFASMPATASNREGAAQITGVSAIAAAVENRLASLELAASASASAGPGGHRSLAQGSARYSLDSRSVENTPETTSPETLPSEAPAYLTGSEAAHPLENIAPVQFESGQKDPSENVAEKAPAEDVAAATFADAVAKNALEMPKGEDVGPTMVASAKEDEDTNSDAGTQESMDGDMKTKSGKSNWHQIRNAPPKAATASEMVEAAKQAEPGTEEPAKAMAAAAAEGSVSASASVTDASTIASIVDSVMADLRPKIVEEIAKKLAGK